MAKDKYIRSYQFSTVVREREVDGHDDRNLTHVVATEGERVLQMQQLEVIMSYAGATSGLKELISIYYQFLETHPRLHLTKKIALRVYRMRNFTNSWLPITWDPQSAYLQKQRMFWLHGGYDDLIKNTQAAFLHDPSLLPKLPPQRKKDEDNE